MGRKMKPCGSPWGAPIVLALLFTLSFGTSARAESVTFRFVPTAEVSQISIRGEFNSWGETAMTMGTDGSWSVTLDLGPGRYAYKYFIDGQWPSDMSAGNGGQPLDPDADEYVDDGFGGKNAIRMIGEGSVLAKAMADLGRLEAHWVSRETLLWTVDAIDGRRFFLHAAPRGGLEITDSGVEGGTAYELTASEGPIDAAVRAKFPHLSKRTPFRLSAGDAARAEGIVRGQVAISAVDEDGEFVTAAGIQIPGLLDELFAYDGPLGIEWKDGAPTLHLWAPTARAVRVRLYDDASFREIVTMEQSGGVWSVKGDPGWDRLYYLYEVEVYVPSSGAIETNLVTDPYSRSLSMNSTRSQIVDLTVTRWKPEGWDDLEKPPLEAPEDIVLYELHVRDFSARDITVDEHMRGTYAAFSIDGRGTQHLARLAEAGLTHVHLLPCFDIATIDEEKSNWRPLPNLAGMPVNSEEQQELTSAIRGQDGYNWGYDPYHFGVPEGSYSTDPDGPTRILEFRGMVQSLSDMGLRVVMDVVYNHTHASGLGDKSVFDKIVPGYYHRLNDQGRVETSTCCQNTASEHAMVERFMIDDLVHWAVDYKVDGFRFDLMGHHMKRNMVAVRAALDRLNLSEHGVDGRSIYVYGEGWDFGEVRGGQRGQNATQAAMAGTGIGTFNDRIRDAARGGNPFGDRREQGFLTGRYYAPNGFQGSSPNDQTALLEAADRVRIGMAGNLAGYRFVDRTGKESSGRQLQNTGYAGDPQETINYISAHDNETWFDKLAYASSASVTLDEYVRMQNLGMSAIALGQGIPFFHAGVEMLRSKSMDADSYDSGDHFNRLDYSYKNNNFGVGLPPAEKNRDRWDILRPILARKELRAGKKEIQKSVDHFERMLRIRKSSPLFRLRDAEEIAERVRFHNTGPGQKPGMIVMSLSDLASGTKSDGSAFVRLDGRYRRILVILNAHPEAQTYEHPSLRGQTFALHPELSADVDPGLQGCSFAGGTFTTSGRTAVVWVQE